jgi:hypothetical protein
MSPFAVALFATAALDAAHDHAQLPSVAGNVSVTATPCSQQPLPDS